MLHPEFEKLFENLQSENENWIKPCRFGYFFENRCRDFLKRAFSPLGWHFKERRPFKVVHLEEPNEVFIVFLSTSEENFYCQTDIDLNLHTQESLEIDLSKCNFNNNSNCRWISPQPSKVFKLRDGRRVCYLFRFAKEILLECSEFCGFCPEEACDPRLKQVVAFELKKFNTGENDG